MMAKVIYLELHTVFKIIRLIGLHVCKVKYSARRQIRPSTCTTKVVHISQFTRQTKAVRLYVKSFPHLASGLMGIPFIAHTDTRVLQIQLLSIPIPQIAPKLSQP